MVPTAASRAIRRCCAPGPAGAGRAAAVVGRLLLRILDGERLSDVLERPLLGAHAEEDLREAAHGRHDRADEESGRDLSDLAGVDQVAEPEAGRGVPAPGSR